MGDNLMKIINTPAYHQKIREAQRKIRLNRIRRPSDGGMINVIDKYTRNGKWQVEYIFDTRFRKNPYIAAFYFKCGEGAVGVLYKEIENII